MRIVVQNRLGVIRGKHEEYTEERYLELSQMLREVYTYSCFKLSTDTGDVFIHNKMIKKSTFSIEK